MSESATYNCKCCGKPFVARVADRARGWARFCSKSCKAAKQEQRTGQFAAHLSRTDHAEHDEAMAGREYGWDGHKEVLP